MSDEKFSDDSFLEEEPSSKQEEGEEASHSQKRFSPPPSSPPFDLDDVGNKDSFVTALENPADLSSPPPDNFAGGPACMSTIDEESRSYQTSTGASISRRLLEEADYDEESQANDSDKGQSRRNNVDSCRDLNESQELREFQQLVKETSEELKESEKPTTSIPTAQDTINNPEVLSANNPDRSTRSIRNDEGLEALLLKLEKLESAQNVLEEALNAGTNDTIDLDELIAQLPLDASQLLPKSNRRGGTNIGEEDLSQRSFSSEIASIRKIIDGADMSISVNLGVARGNNNLLQSSTDDSANIGESEAEMIPYKSMQGQRSVDDVLKEYEEFERSLSRGTAIDESFRSDITSAPLSANSNQEDQVKVPETTLLSPIKSVPPALSSTAPVIKPVLKASISQPPSSDPATKASAAGPSGNKSQMSFGTSAREVCYYNESGGDGSSSRTRPMTSNNKHSGSRSSRLEASHSAHGFQQHPTHSARTAASSTAASGRDANFEGLNTGRNRRMRSPRTVTANSPRHSNDSFVVADIPNNLSSKGGGEGYHHQKVLKMDENSSNQHRTHHHVSKNRKDKMDAIVATEALKTIEKLNTMVARQETLLDAFSKDNEKLWKQLKEAKSESQEKETKFHDVINSLKTEVATLKLNRLVTSPAYNPPQPPPSTTASPRRNNRGELQAILEDSELKSHQISELRKEILLLQTKLATRSKSPAKQKQVSAKEQSNSQEKEKEYQKTIIGLNKQVRTLQRILYSKDESAPPPPPAFTAEGNRGKPMQRTKSDMTRHSIGSVRQVQQQRAGLRNVGMTDASSGATGRKIGAGTPGKSVNIKTGDVLQASLNCIEQEREEFESIIAEKNKLLFEKERMLLDLKEEIEILKSKVPEGEVVEPGIIDELRSRIIAQNQVIQTLKQHMSTFKKLEADNLLLREEKRSLEKLGKDLRRKLEFAQSLVKPENEVLCLLSEKVDELNSRYYQRERQLDGLLNRLTIKTTTVGGGELISSSSSSNDSSNSTGGGYIHSSINLSPRRRLPLDQFNNNNGSLGGFQQVSASSIGGGKCRTTGLTSADILHMVNISPSDSFKHFDTEFPDM